MKRFKESHFFMFEGGKRGRKSILKEVTEVQKDLSEAFCEYLAGCKVIRN